MFFYCYVYVIMLTLNCCSSIKIIVWGKKKIIFLQNKTQKKYIYKQNENCIWNKNNIRYIYIFAEGGGCWVVRFACKVKWAGGKWNGKWMEKQPSFFFVCCIYTYFLYYIYYIFFSTILSSRLSHVKLPTCCWQFCVNTLNSSL